MRFRGLVVRAVDGGGSRRVASGRRVYRESQAEFPPAPFKQVASFVAPAGAFLAVTFGMDWISLLIQSLYLNFVCIRIKFMVKFNVNA